MPDPTEYEWMNPPKDTRTPKEKQNELPLRGPEVERLATCCVVMVSALASVFALTVVMVIAIF